MSEKTNSESAEAPDIESRANFSGIAFELNQSSGQLFAVLTPGQESKAYDLTTLKGLLRQSGYIDVAIDDSILVTLLRKHRSGSQDRILLGERIPPIQLRLDYNDETRELYGELVMGDKAEDISFAYIQARLKKDGYGQVNVRAQDISAIVLKYQQKKLGRCLLGKKPEYTHIRYTLDETDGKLYADLSSSEKEVIASRATINQQLKALGYSQFHFAPSALDKLYTQATKNERGRFAIGEKRDAHVEVRFEEEMMKAWITVSPPHGGRDLDEHLLKIALDNAGIYRECCDSAVLEKLLKDKSADDLEFACGIEPEDGLDAQFDPLVEEVEYSKPKETKTGKIDLKEIINFTLIEADVPLMRRTPAKAGINGRNVLGQVIPAVDGVDNGFDEELHGAIVSEDDPNLLVSTCKGHPVVMPQGVRVDNSIVVNNVDMSTGNISYDGSLLVKGEVKAGMKIRVTGDIIVKGVVSKATLIAKNNITVECGILGSDPTKDGEESPPAVVKAGGDITAQYINLATVQAGNDVKVREYLSHCSVDAKNQIQVGKKGGKGRIFGGRCYGRSGVYANSVGASGGTKTQIDAGTPGKQQKQYENLNKNHENRITQAKQLSDMLTKYRAAAKEDEKDEKKLQKITAIKKVLKEIENEIEKMETTIQTISQHFKDAKDAEVAVAKTTYPNVFIFINGAEFMIRQESKGGIFKKQGNDIRWLNFKR